ncbi:MAG: type II/IV secretion system protein [Parcubacteria group bacterium]|nr:type II/IV secretion system protein [Parcubacteria group bacterium]
MASKMNDTEIKELLLEYELLTAKDIEEAAAAAKTRGEDLYSVLVEENFISDKNFGQILADKLGMDFVRLAEKDIPDPVLRVIPEAVAKKNLIICFGLDTKVVKLAMNDPDSEIAFQIEKKVGTQSERYYATRKDIEATLLLYQKNIQEKLDIMIKRVIKTVEEKISEGAKLEESPIIEIVDTLLQYAYQNKASDIHLEPGSHQVTVRFRIDGILHDILSFSKNIFELIVTRIKILSKLRTDEHLSAQDGKFSFQMPKGRGDVRVSIVPITEGEKIVMRLLAEKTEMYTLTSLGLSSRDMKTVKEAMKKPHGMILVTGPTGSGKTTTLYAILKLLNSREINIATIEDPVEIQLDGVNQIQVNSRTNLTFAKGLRSILRQDPDVIMVGEIRDEETASIAINAAMTGHLVLSTLHTNDAATTLPRLADMHIEPFLIASSVNIALAQRLVRKICPSCIESVALKGKELENVKKLVDLDAILKKKKKQVNVFRGKGCKVCHELGYKGRTALFEVMVMSDEIRRLIMKNSDASVIHARAVKEGMVTMLMDGIEKALQGVTTIEEVLRVAVD